MTRAGVRAPALIAAVVIAACVTACVTACGASTSVRRAQATRATAPTGSVLATPSPARDGLERFSAPGMSLHFLYPEIFRPQRPTAPQQSEGDSARASDVAFAEVGLSARDVLFVVDLRDPTQRITRANATQQQGGLDAGIDALTETESHSTIHEEHGDVIYEWPAVIAPSLPGDSTDQYTEIFTPTDEYELECISDPADRARVDTACQEALASLSTS